MDICGRWLMRILSEHQASTRWSRAFGTRLAVDGISSSWGPFSHIELGGRKQRYV